MPVKQTTTQTKRLSQLNWIYSIALAVFMGGFASQLAWHLTLNHVIYRNNLISEVGK